MDTHESDAALLAQYVAAFAKLDDLCTLRVPPMLQDRTEANDREHWHPWQTTTLPSALEALYLGLGLSGRGSTRFPPLYETLLCSYRWLEVDLGNYRLLANEPAEDLSPLLATMRTDPPLFETLVPNGYIPFGKGPDLDYDPVCFDFRQRQKNGDCRIVQIDHEAILCYGRIGETTELAPNFRYLVLNTIQRAAWKQHSPSQVGNQGD